MEDLFRDPLKKLSSRESEVLKLIIQGFSRTQIAHTMSISKLTYDSYRKSIRAKLDIKNQFDWARILSDISTKSEVHKYP